MPVLMLVQNPTTKYCVDCGIDLPFEDFYTGKNGKLIVRCKECHKKKTINRSAGLRERGLCILCGSSPKQAKNGKCAVCWERERTRTKIWRSCIMQDVINLYGGKCACCEETTFEFLTIDHKNNDGHIERKQNGWARGGYTFYRKLLSLDYLRDDLQVLCYNCNNGKTRNGGVCPHHGKIE